MGGDHPPAAAPFPNKAPNPSRASGIPAKRNKCHARGCETIPQSPTPLTPRAAAPAAACVAGRSTGQHMPPQPPSKQTATAPPPQNKKSKPLVPSSPEGVKESPSDTGATSKEKNNIVIPEFSAWLTLVLEQCRAENIRNLPRQRAPTPLFPERRPREACSMPISGCHDLPLATFNLPSRNNLQNKPNSAATMSLPCSRFATAQPQRRWDAPPGGGDSGYFHSAIAK